MSLIWQLLKGNPVVENVLYWKQSTVLPSVGTNWQALSPWIQWGVPTNHEFLNPDPDKPFDLKITESQPRYLLVAVPLANINGDASGLDGEKKIKLNEVYDIETPEYTYDFTYMDVPNDDSGSGGPNSGFRIYYMPYTKIIGPSTLRLEFNEA